MGKVSIGCPRCGGKIKASWDDKKPWVIKDVKGASWYPLLKQEGPNQWVEDWREGIGFHCKCGRAYFVYNITEESIEISTDLKQDFSVAWFCEHCGIAFINPEIECPICHQQYM